MLKRGRAVTPSPVHFPKTIQSAYTLVKIVGARETSSFIATQTLIDNRDRRQVQLEVWFQVRCLAMHSEVQG
jgi:hypothetical protein